MDIVLVQKPIFCSSSECYELPSSKYYTPYNTPPYIAHHQAGSSNWQLGDLQQQQMQYLRFPTPPITPPRSNNIIQLECATRTQSVIMKCSKNVITESCSEHSSCSSECDFICNWQECGRVFESLEALAQHVTLRHAIACMADGLYYCRWNGCQRSERGFNARYKMLVHVRTHTKEKPHRCHLCDKSFSRAENLKIHIRSHSGEKPYKCHFEGCQKAYSNSSDRFKHTRTHSMEKPYVCKVSGCQKRYTDPSSLRKHVKTFKHSIQLIASQSSASCEVPYTCLPLHPAPIITPCESSPSATPYYLEMTENANVASDYSMRSKHDGAYTTSAYWLNTPEHGSYRYLHSEDYSMDMELESPAPLDLRVHRS